MENQTQLTRGTIKLIKEVQSNMEPQDRNNRIQLCKMVSMTLEEKFGGGNLEYQTERMGLVTTGKILEKIDTYFHKYSKNFEDEYKDSSDDAIVNS